MVRLTATAPSGPVSFDVPLPSDEAASHSSVRTLAARARIRELEEGSDWLSARGSQQRDRKVSSARDEIIALSLRYRLISRETSFVAVERRDTPVTADIKLRKVPIALTTGWGGLERRPPLPTLRARIASQPLFGSSATPPIPMPGRGASTMDGSARPTNPLLSRRSRPTDLEFDPVDDEAEHEEILPPSPRNRVRSQRPGSPRQRVSEAAALILLQEADGSWDLTLELASLLGRDLEELRAAMPPVTARAAPVRRVWATALAIAWLDRHAADRKNEWHLLAEKGRNWIQHTALVPSGGKRWTELATEYLAR
jgi:hypothetical protein